MSPRRPGRSLEHHRQQVAARRDAGYRPSTVWTPGAPEPRTAMSPPALISEVGVAMGVRGSRRPDLDRPALDETRGIERRAVRRRDLERIERSAGVVVELLTHQQHIDDLVVDIVQGELATSESARSYCRPGRGCTSWSTWWSHSTAVSRALVSSVVAAGEVADVEGHSSPHDGLDVVDAGVGGTVGAALRSWSSMDHRSLPIRRSQRGRRRQRHRSPTAGTAVVVARVGGTRHRVDVRALRRQRLGVQDVARRKLLMLTL